MSSCLTDYEKRLDEAESNYVEALVELERSSDTDGSGSDHPDEVEKARDAYVKEVESIRSDLKAHINDLWDCICDCNIKINEANKS